VRIDRDGAGRIEVDSGFFARAGDRAVVIMIESAAYVRPLKLVEGSGRLG